jgi:hypothetical protein
MISSRSLEHPERGTQQARRVGRSHHAAARPGVGGFVGSTVPHPTTGDPPSNHPSAALRWCKHWMK